MANAYSTAINYGSPIPVGNTIQYLGAIQNSMQQKFDINLAKIDDLISKVATVPLARDKDKQYLGEKLQGLLSMVDANSKVDLTDNVVARQISSYIASAIDSNVREQLANSQKISSYQQTAAQRKKDKPELYSDANYAYGLDKSGYAAYMKGDTDSLGSMQYIDYYDVDKNLNKEIEAFAKERGFEKVLSSGTEGNEYIYKTVKGKSIDPQEINNFIDSKLASDPRLKQQFMINSHYNYRGLSDEDIIKSYKEKAEPILKEFDTKIADKESKLKNINPDDKATLDLLHREKAEIQKQKDSFSSQLDTKNFNRDSFLYDRYTDSLRASYMKTYSYSATTDVKYDDFLLSIAKAKGEVSADGTPTGTGANTTGLPGGTLFQTDMVATNKDEQPDYMTDFNTQRTSSWNELQGVIKAQLIKEGKGTTVKDITNYYVGLKKASKDGIDLNAQGYNSELLSAYGKVENLNKTAYQLTKVAKENYGKSTESILTGLFGGKAKDLSVEGLATTAPYTAELLKKYKSSDQLTTKQKALAKYELAKNLKQYVLEDDRERTNMDFYINSLKRENNISDKELASYNKLKPGQEDFGFFGGAWEAAKLVGSRIADAPGNIVATLATPFRRSESNAKGQEEYDKNQAEYDKRRENLDRNLYRGISKMFTSDSDLSEIQSGDIKLGKYQGVGDLIKDTSTSVSSRFEEILAKGKANLQKESSIVLSPASKRDKPYLDAINSAIVAQGGTPVQDGFVNIKSIKDGIATISYTSEEMVETKTGGTKKQNVPGVEIKVPVNNLPQNLIKNLQTSLSDWSYSYMNPTSMKVSMKYSPPKDLESKYDLVQKYVQNNSAYMTPEEIRALQVNGFSAMKTKEDYLKLAEKALPPEYVSEFKTKYLDSKYTVEWERPEGGGAFIGYIVKDGTKVKVAGNSYKDYNPYRYGADSMEVISKYLEDQITEYRRKSMSLNN